MIRVRVCEMPKVLHRRRLDFFVLGLRCPRLGRTTAVVVLVQDVKAVNDCNLRCAVLPCDDFSLVEVSEMAIGYLLVPIVRRYWAH